MEKLILHDFYTKCGANFTGVKNMIIPKDYGDVNSELYALKNKVALFDRSYLGKLKLKGCDALKDTANRIIKYL
jgi:glycine cleavage system aminomethyltransferase T